MHRPYLTCAEVAEYLGYTPGYFSELSYKFQIPRKGPGRNRFLVDDLHKFMDDPTCFMNGEPEIARSRAGKFTPVQL